MNRRKFLLTMASAVTLPLSRTLLAGAQAQSQSPGLGGAGNFAPFAFGYVTDVHLTTGQPDGYRLLQQSQLFLQDCVKQLNAENLDFVVFGGDQVEKPGQDDKNWQLFVDIAQTLTCPWTFVLGETDVSGTPPPNKWTTYGPDWKTKGIDTNKTYWSQTPLPSVHLIGLDTSRPNSTAGDLSNEQLDWLKADLAANRGKFTIVFSHHPLLPPPPFDTGPPWDDSLVAQEATAREILNSSRYVRLAVSGHVNVSKIQKERNIWYVSSPSLDVYPCAFRIFRVTPSQITVETYQISFPALVKKGRQTLQTSTLAFKYNESKPQLFLDVAEGSRLDQEAVLPFDGTSAQPLGKHKRERPAAPKDQEKDAPRDKKHRGKPKDEKQPGDANADAGDKPPEKSRPWRRKKKPAQPAGADEQSKQGEKIDKGQSRGDADLQPQTGLDTSQDTGKDTGKDTSKDTGKDTGKDAGKDTDTGKDDGKSSGDN